MRLKVKGSDIYIPPLTGQGNLKSSAVYNSKWRTCWPALAVGGAAQLAAAHCANGLWTRSLLLDRRTNAPTSRNYGLNLAMFSGNSSFIVASITRY